MASTPEIIVGASSTIVRLAAFIFLRWIPGHHLPPAILLCVLIYLFYVFGKPDAFGSSRPTLHEAFPQLFPRKAEDEKEGADKDGEEPILYDDERSFFKIAVFGIPNWREAEWSFLTIGVNVLLALFTLDLVFRAPLFYPENDLRFSRVGYVDSTSAKVLFREPDPAQLPLYVYLSPADKTNWITTDTVYYLGDETDFTYPITFSNLEPSRKYVYSLSNDLSGTFTTAPSAYSDEANTLTFVTSSCIKANFPYRPDAHALALHGFKHLSKVLQSLPSPASFMLFLGDFIYIDVPMRLASSVAHYRAEYRRIYASPSWQLPGVALPWLHTLDDHEIANDWASGNASSPFPEASDPFVHYHVSVNPPLPPDAVASRSRAEDTNTTYFQFTRGPTSFFMLDTRRYRTSPEGSPFASAFNFSNATSASQDSEGGEEEHSMLGPHQLASLLRFLNTRPPPSVHWLIVASSVPFTQNWRFGTSDTWGGFMSERRTVLAAMHAAERNHGVRVVILSGDRHEFAAVRFPPTPSPSPSTTPETTTTTTTTADDDPAATDTDGPHEFSVGPLSMFYLPFRTFRQVDDQDVALAYLPDGNSKVGAVEVRNVGGPRGGGRSGAPRSVLTYRLYVDGKVAWEYALTSPGKAYWEREEGSGWGWARAKARALWE